MKHIGLGAVCALLLVACGEDDKTVDPCLDLQPGAACTWAGTKGQEGFNGDGLPRWETALNQTQDIVFLPDGRAIISDFNNYLIRRINLDGTVDSIVGWTDPIFPGDGPVTGIPAGGAAGEDWRLNHPTNLILLPTGKVMLVGWHNHKLLEIDPDTGWVQVMYGGGAGYRGDGGSADQLLLRQPNDATMDEDGNIYVLDQANQRIRMIDVANNTVDTIAGTGQPGYMDGDGVTAQFAWEGGSNPNPSGGIVYHADMLYISDTLNHRIRAMDLTTGMVSTLAGTGEAGFSGDGGPASDAKIHLPGDIEIGPDGDLYFADTNNGAVRAINLTTGVIRTVVGTGELGMREEEGLPATEFSLRRPFGVSFDNDGNLFVMDALNFRIVKVAAP